MAPRGGKSRGKWTPLDEAGGDMGGNSFSGSILAIGLKASSVSGTPVNMTFRKVLLSVWGTMTLEWGARY